MRVAVFQADAAQRSAQQRVEQLQQMLLQHRDRPVDLVLCPELFLSGYGNAERILSSATHVDGDLISKMAALARQFNVMLCFGYPETHEQQCFNSALCLSRHGECLANHRKRVLPNRYEQGLFECGQGVTVFDLDNGWRAGIVICYESEFPEAVRQCAVAGAQLVLVPTALSREWRVVSRCVIPTRAFENGVYLAYANYAGQDEHGDYIGDSVILSPRGEDMARASNAEVWIDAELDLDRIASIRDRLPYLEDYSLLGESNSR